MNKKMYIAPEVEITTWDKSDVITTSALLNANYAPSFGNSDKDNGEITSTGSINYLFDRQ